MSQVHIIKKLHAFKRRFFLLKTARGLLYWLAGSGGLWLLFMALEDQFWLSSASRGVFYFTFLGLSAAGATLWVLAPAWKLLHKNKYLSDEAAARQVGEKLPEIRDKLLNYIQLQKYASQSALARAGLAQRSGWLGGMVFMRAIPWRGAWSYFRYLGPVLAVFLLLWAIQPDFIAKNTERIYHYDRAYVAPAPFDFVLLHDSLDIFLGEAFELKIQVKGNDLPEQVQLVTAGRHVNMQALGKSNFSHRFEGIHQDVLFHFEANGHTSAPYRIRSLPRPVLLQAKVSLYFPKHTGRPMETLTALSHMEVPEGTSIDWQFRARSTDSISLYIGKQERLQTEHRDRLFYAAYRFFRPSDYRVVLRNQHAVNQHVLRYRVDVRKDAPPQLYERVKVDTMLYKWIRLSGYAIDDYAVRALNVEYQVRGERGTQKGLFALPFSRHSGREQAHFRFDWALDSLKLPDNQSLKYRIQAWDNDAIHGSKSAFSPWYQLRLPGAQDFQAKIGEAAQKQAQSAHQPQRINKELQEYIKALQEQLKLKKTLGWLHKQQLKSLLKKRSEANEQLEKLKKQQNFLEDVHKRFDKDAKNLENELKHLRDLIEKMMDPETQRLYEDLQKQLQKSKKVPRIQSLLEQISQKEALQSKNFERLVALMKHLRHKIQGEQVVKQLQRLAKSQEALRERTEKHSNFDTLAQQQKKLQQRFEAIQKNVKEWQKSRDTLQLPTQNPSLKKAQEDIYAKQEESRRQLQQRARKSAQEAQKEAEKAIQKLQKKLKNLQQKSDKKQVKIDVQQMKRLLRNLLFLSFEQENLVKITVDDTHTYMQQDSMAQKQFDIQHAARSTLEELENFALHNFDINSELNKEVQAARLKLEACMSAMRNRESQKAALQQRYAMQSFNKLALFTATLLEKVAKGKQPGGGGQKKMPSVAELQQKLLEKMRELKKSTKGGKMPSEALVRMMAEQEAIRRRMEELQKSRQGMLSHRTELQKLLKEMQNIERKIAHKSAFDTILEQMKKTQTRLLDFEHALKEDEHNQRRKGQQATQKRQNTPPNPSFPEDKKQEVAPLQRFALPLNPYYEKEVNEYFKRLQQQEIRDKLTKTAP